MTSLDGGKIAEMKFFADSMLGKLCRWLRLMGYDVRYAPSNMADTKIIEICSQGNLILLTRDAELSRRYPNSMYFTSDQYAFQIRDFLRRFPPDPAKYFTRCPLCNGILERKADSEVLASLPEGVRRTQDHVYRCTECGKIYWEGTHYLSILGRIHDFTGLTSREKA